MQEIFILSKAFRPSVGPTPPPVQWVPGALYSDLMAAASEADLLTPVMSLVQECEDL